MKRSIKSSLQYTVATRFRKNPQNTEQTKILNGRLIGNFNLSYFSVLSKFSMHSNFYCFKKAMTIRSSNPTSTEENWKQGLYDTCSQQHYSIISQLPKGGINTSDQQLNEQSVVDTYIGVLFNLK